MDFFKNIFRNPCPTRIFWIHVFCKCFSRVYIIACFSCRHLSCHLKTCLSLLIRQDFWYNRCWSWTLAGTVFAAWSGALVYISLIVWLSGFVFPLEITAPAGLHWMHRVKENYISLVLWNTDQPKPAVVRACVRKQRHTVGKCPVLTVTRNNVKIFTEQTPIPLENAWFI